jgi:hypothetical protein
MQIVLGWIHDALWTYGLHWLVNIQHIKTVCHSWAVHSPHHPLQLARTFCKFTEIPGWAYPQR